MSISEKGPLALLITGTTVVAFAASNLFVFGLSIALHHDLASHFEILDWVRITPVWALPAALYCGIVTGSGLLAVIVGGARRLVGWALALIPFLLLASSFLTFYTGVSLVAAIIGTVLISFFSPWVSILVVWAFQRATPNQQEFLRTILGPTIMVPKKFVYLSVVWLNVLSFAFFFGLFVAPILLRNKSPTRVILAEEVEVKGILIFRLSHSVLLLTKRHGSPLVVIPEEKIQRIESLKNQYLPGPRRSTATPKLSP
jgi:hypothetical protein